MDCKQLEDFLALDQHGNYSRAATQRHITQPALSRYIKALEGMLSVPLFDRTTAPATLTCYGERFEPYTRHILSMLTRTRHKLLTMTPATSNALVMVSLHTLLMNILPDMINYLRQDEPQLNFTVNASIQGIDNYFNALTNRQIDLLITYDLPSAQPGLETAGGLKRSLWWYERFIPVISARLADALNDPHASIPWLYYGDYTSVRRIIESAEQRVRPRLKKVFESGLGETIREMVLRHMGMAWLPESMVVGKLVSQQIIHYWPESTDLICEIPVVVWASLEDQHAVMQRCWEKLLRF